MELIRKIEHWAEDRNLIEGSNSTKQFLKLGEEMGELASGLAKGRHDVVKDSIGDMVVVLTILARQEGLEILDCVDQAYNEIKDRKGRMVDGVFVKESDLK
jgi:NTP pyrophosphatase (non-canonical NTP hydrolase)